MDRKIKVLQVVNTDYFLKSMVKPLVDRLIEEGYEVHVICQPGLYIKDFIRKGYKINLVRINRKISPIFNLISLYQIYKFIKKERPDLVHVHTPMAAAIGRVAAKLAKVPVIIYTAHGFYFHENMPLWKKKFYVGIEKLLGKYFTDMVLTQSKEDMLTAKKEKIIGNDSIICVGNGIDVRKFRGVSSNKKLKNSFRFNDSNKVICFVGKILKEKGVLDLISAMRIVVGEVPESRLLIVGDVLESDRDKKTIKKVKKLVKKNNLEKNIVFTGFREDIPRILSMTDVFVLPSHREGMPRSILEAMASGKPIVATNIRGCREEVVDGVTGLLIPVKDQEALAKSIIKILTNRELAVKMGEEGRKRVIKEFDEKNVLDKQMEIYDKLIK